jgi:hypothetical protein
MDKVVTQEFKNELPLIITRALISAGAKAAAAYGLNQATRGDQTTNDIVRVVTTVYQFATNEADLRTWKTLPKFICLARFPTPADRQISLSVPGGNSVGQIKLVDGMINVVYVKSVAATTPPTIRQFKLK